MLYLGEGMYVPPHASALGTAAAQTAREESFMSGGVVLDKWWRRDLREV